jgi:DHA2 family multidrug resistance protein
MSVAAPKDAVNRGPITFFLAISALLVTLDTTIANVALPHVMGSISAAPDQITWVVTSYMVASAVSMPLTGWLEGRFGRKAILLAAVGGFTVSSMLCGLADSLPQIVASRILQGAFGAPLMPLTQAQLFDMNPPERHGRAMAVFGLGSLLGPVIGPTAGGFITDNYSWRWIFFVNAPVGAAAFLGLFLLMSHSRRGQPRRFDFLGYGMLAVFLASLQLVLDRGPREDWFSSPEIWAHAIAAAIGLWVFVFHSASAEHPFFHPRLAKEPTFVAMGVFGLFGFMMLMSTSALLPLMIQSVLGYPALTTGLVLIPRGVGATIGTVGAGRLLGRVDPRLIMAAGLVLIAFSMSRMAHFDLGMDRRALLFAGFFQGLGFGSLMVPATTLGFTMLPVALRAEGAALQAVLRNIGGSAGIAAMQALITHQTQAMHASMAAQVIPSDPMVSSGLAPMFDPATPAGAFALDAVITRQATMVAYVDDFIAMLFIALGCMPLLFLIRKPRQSGGDPIHAASH